MSSGRPSKHDDSKRGIGIGKTIDLDIETDHRQLTVVFLQYDREKYEGALETLMALLCGLDNVSFRLIVVDN